ncbi:MAG: hypothetical protein IJY47_01480 [Clostridia bacterium]|nr:hypothetical protein [Clostridia bacterium]
MKKKIVPILLSLYAVVLCTILIVSVLFLLHALKRERELNQNTETADPIYVYLEKETVTTEAETSSELEGYWVREYREKIGVFLPDGTLYQILDTYVKTLPKADQSLLKEGIYLENDIQLNALIEDYTS